MVTESIWVLTEEEQSRLNPPDVKMKTLKDGLYERHLDSDEWLRVGYIPRPKSRLGWFIYHLAHGVAMRYPLIKVISYSLMELKSPTFL